MTACGIDNGSMSRAAAKPAVREVEKTYLNTYLIDPNNFNRGPRLQKSELLSVRTTLRGGSGPSDMLRSDRAMRSSAKQAPAERGGEYKGLLANKKNPKARATGVRTVRLSGGGRIRRAKIKSAKRKAAKKRISAGRGIRAAKRMAPARRALRSKPTRISRIHRGGPKFARKSSVLSASTSAVKTSSDRTRFLSAAEGRGAAAKKVNGIHEAHTISAKVDRKNLEIVKRVVEQEYRKAQGDLLKRRLGGDPASELSEQRIGRGLSRQGAFANTLEQDLERRVVVILAPRGAELTGLAAEFRRAALNTHAGVVMPVNGKRLGVERPAALEPRAAQVEQNTVILTDGRGVELRLIFMPEINQPTAALEIQGAKAGKVDWANRNGRDGAEAFAQEVAERYLDQWKRGEEPSLAEVRERLLAEHMEELAAERELQQNAQGQGEQFESDMHLAKIEFLREYRRHEDSSENHYGSPVQGLGASVDPFDAAAINAEGRRIAAEYRELDEGRVPRTGLEENTELDFANLKMPAPRAFLRNPHIQLAA